MQVSIENITNIERRLTISVPVDDIQAAYSKQIEQFMKTSNLKGFRRGKAPRSFIEQNFGEDARRKAISDVIQQSLYKALVEHKLSPVSTPEVEAKVIEPHKPLEFTASFEVLPKIEKINFELTTINKLAVEITEKDIDTVVEQLLKQHTQWNIVDRPAEMGDKVVIDYQAEYEGKSDKENKVQNFPLELGSGIMIAGFEEGLIGAKASEEKKLNLVFPADYNNKDKAGKPVIFEVQIKQVIAGNKPELNDSFVKRLGIESGKLEELRTQIKDSLIQEKERLVKENLKEQVFKELLEKNTLELPRSLITKEAKNIHDEVYSEHQGHDHNHSDEEMGRFEEIAKKRVALGLLIAEYAKQADLKVNPSLVNARIEQIASVYQNPKEVAEWLSSKERRAGIESQVIEDQVVEKLIENKSTIEKTLTYAELKGIHNK